MTARLCLRAAAVALTVIAVIGSPAWAGAPTDALRDHIDRILVEIIDGDRIDFRCSFNLFRL